MNDDKSTPKQVREWLRLYFLREERIVLSSLDSGQESAAKDAVLGDGEIATLMIDDAIVRLETNARYHRQVLGAPCSWKRFENYKKLWDSSQLL